MLAGRLDLLFHFSLAKKRCRRDSSAVGNAAFVLYLCARSMYRGLILKKKRAYTWYTFKVRLSCLIQVIVARGTQENSLFYARDLSTPGWQSGDCCKKSTLQRFHFVRIWTQKFSFKFYISFVSITFFEALNATWLITKQFHPTQPRPPSLHFLEAFSWMNWT